MSKKQILQLTIVSQNDPQCGCGNELTGEITGFRGGILRNDSFPVNEPVKLPVPAADPSKSPTWFLELENGLEDAEFMIKIQGPGLDHPVQIIGKDIPAAVKQNEKEKTNQIFLESACGIFGYAQKNEPAGSDTIYWIYTVTAGVSYPQVHPPVEA